MLNAFPSTWDTHLTPGRGFLRRISHLQELPGAACLWGSVGVYRSGVKLPWPVWGHLPVPTSTIVSECHTGIPNRS